MIVCLMEYIILYALLCNNHPESVFI
jgi:hypothetical protein